MFVATDDPDPAGADAAALRAVGLRPLLGPAAWAGAAAAVRRNASFSPPFLAFPPSKAWTFLPSGDGGGGVGGGADG